MGIVRTTTVCASAAVCLLVSVSLARADTCTWTGAAANDKWSTPANWAGDCAGTRAPRNDDALIFADGAPRPASVDDIDNLSVSAVTIAGAASVEWHVSANRLTINGPLAGTGSLIKSGTGQLFLRGAQPNTLSGTITAKQGELRLNKPTVNATIVGPLIINGGDVSIDADHQIADDVAVIVEERFLSLNDHKETVGSIAGTNGLVSLNFGTLTFGANNSSTTYSGPLGAPVPPPGLPPEQLLRLVKIGTGTFRMMRSSAPLGQVVVEAGTLAVNAQMTATDVIVRGGTLVGTGRFNNFDGQQVIPSRIVVNDGGTISPGDPVGVLRADGVAIESGGALALALNGIDVDTGYDRLELKQDLTLAAGARLVVTRGFEPARDTRFTIVTLADGKAVIGTFAGLPEGGEVTVDGRRFGITYHGGDGNDIVLTALDTPATLTYYLAEGATGSFFDEDVLVANPNDTEVSVTYTFSTQEGEQSVVKRRILPKSLFNFHVDQFPELANTALSTQVTSEFGLPLLVERTMFFGPTHTAGHTGAAVDRPSQDWSFAEGSQGDFFQTFVLVINPNPTPTDVTFTFFLENEPPVVHTRTVAGSTRLTVFAGDVPALVGRSFGIAVHATQPIMADRSMYFGATPTTSFSGGHESAGVTTPSKRWFLAEGATGGFFDTFILLSNPTDELAIVDLTYLLDAGEPITIFKNIQPHARLTVDIESEEDDRLRNAAVSTLVESNVPIIAERSMYWPTAVQPWGEGHNSFGVVDAHTRWGLAEGRVGGPLNFHTYILLANPEPRPANVTVTFLRQPVTGPIAPVVKTYTVAPTSRFNIDASTVTELQNESFGAVIEVTNDVRITVERSMYWDVNGVVFSGGTNATGIRLP